HRLRWPRLRELEELGQRRAERHLVQSWSRDVPRYAEEPRARRPFRARRRERSAPLVHDLQHVEEGLHVVHDRRHAEQTDFDREWRLVARLAAVALDRLEERGLLTADVRTRTDPQLDVEGKSGVHHVVAEEAVRARLR